MGGRTHRSIRRGAVVTRRPNTDAGRGSPWDLAKLERDAEQAAAAAHTARLKAALAAEIADLHRVAGELRGFAHEIDGRVSWAAAKCPPFLPALERIRADLDQLSGEILAHVAEVPE